MVEGSNSVSAVNIHLPTCLLLNKTTPQKFLFRFEHLAQVVSARDDEDPCVGLVIGKSQSYFQVSPSRLSLAFPRTSSQVFLYNLAGWHPRLQSMQRLIQPHLGASHKNELSY